METVHSTEVRRIIVYVHTSTTVGGTAKCAVHEASSFCKADLYSVDCNVVALLLYVFTCIFVALSYHSTS
jgi:hypothetical protein